MGLSGRESDGMKSSVKHRIASTVATESHGQERITRRLKPSFAPTIDSIRSQSIHGKNAPTPDAALSHGIGFAELSNAYFSPTRIPINTKNNQEADAIDTSPKVWLTMRWGFTQKMVNPTARVTSIAKKISSDMFVLVRARHCCLRVRGSSPMQFLGIVVWSVTRDSEDNLDRESPN